MILDPHKDRMPVFRRSHLTLWILSVRRLDSDRGKIANTIQEELALAFPHSGDVILLHGRAMAALHELHCPMFELAQGCTTAITARTRTGICPTAWQRTRISGKDSGHKGDRQDFDLR
jgi:hypothetical protein